MTAPAGTRASTATAARADRERIDANRALLAHPMLTAAAHPDELALVRLHQAAVANTFKTLLGYDVVIEAAFAKLIKGPLSADTSPRPARRADGTAFTPTTYTHLALLCAALLSPHTGEQILISALIDQVRADAATIGIDLGDTLPERRALVTALNLLIDWGVVTETDGSAAGWGERHEEVLLTVQRAVLPHLLARRLADIDHPDQLLAPDPAIADQPRRSLRRKLVENPLVRREDLTDAERDVLSRERTELTRALEDNFGLTLEVRLEGALAYDTDTGLTDITFPGKGTVAWAALLLLAQLCDTLEPEAGDLAMDDTGRLLPGAKATWEQVDAALAALADTYGKAWGTTWTSALDKLREHAVALLADVGLALRCNDGLLVHPAAGRYRPLPTTSEPTRAQRRLESRLF